MSKQNDSGRKTNRRTVLKSLGAASVLSTAGVSVGSARPERDFQKILEQSHHVREAAGVEKQHKFLRNRGVATALDRTTSKFYRGHGGDGVSTQRLTTDEISLSFSLFYDCDYHPGYGAEVPNGSYVAELSWEYVGDDWNDPGDNPMDYVGIGWDNNTWYYENNNVDDMYSNSDHVNYISGTSGQGPAWEIDDRYTLDNGYRFDGQDYYHVGVHLDWNGSDSLKDNRTIAASYTHTWDGVDITSISVSYPKGVSVGVSDESDRWVKDTYDNGDFLRLRYDDLEGCY